MNSGITRREFLKYTLEGSLGGFLYLNSLPKRTTACEIDLSTPLLGRVFKDDAIIYKQPSFSSGIKYYLKANNVLPLAEEVIGDPINERSKLWYEVTDYGYIPANSIQLVRQRTNQPHEVINSSGELGTITVPYSKAWKADPSTSGSDEYQYFFYGSTHWIKGVYKDSKGDTYYRIVEDRWGDAYYIQAEHIAIFSDEELLPLSIDIPAQDKSIEVNIADQLVIAYEYGKAVFISQASTGLLHDGKDLSTPPGEYRVNYKRPSRHMVHTDKIGDDDSELYGVPWVSYFTDTGIAFHGTYWHNDFGVQRSHGCVNLPIPAAKWIYLWSQPVVPPGQKKYVSNSGTKVTVV
ncbi:MAG: murein L,D-transpeptidase [Anaerolineaceae bacterium]|jgi:lipoprotein-anchoring transpeptidase ErfK/SrfK|nr:MAG: murein L,D-transpeptidase [Anaerolineaceae bacterium]